MLDQTGLGKTTFDERRYDDKGNDIWTTFNVVQKKIMRGGLKGTTTGSNGRTRRTTTRPVKALDRNIKMNQALWFLTEKQADTVFFSSCPNTIPSFFITVAVFFRGRLCYCIL